MIEKRAGFALSSLINSCIRFFRIRLSDVFQLSYATFPRIFWSALCLEIWKVVITTRDIRPSWTCDSKILLKPRHRSHWKSPTIRFVIWFNNTEGIVHFWDYWNIQQLARVHGLKQQILLNIRNTILYTGLPSLTFHWQIFNGRGWLFRLPLIITTNLMPHIFFKTLDRFLKSQKRPFLYFPINKFKRLRK